MEPYAYSDQAYRLFSEQRASEQSGAQAIAVTHPLTEDSLSLSESALLMTALFTLVSSIMVIALL